MGIFEEWLPRAQSAQQNHAARQYPRPRQPGKPATASVRSWRRMRRAARPKRQAQGNFPGTVGCSRRKQAAQVGAGRQQNQPRQQHQAGNKRARRPPSRSPRRPGRASEKVKPSSSFGIGLGQKGRRSIADPRSPAPPSLPASSGRSATDSAPCAGSDRSSLQSVPGPPSAPKSRGEKQLRAAKLRRATPMIVKGCLFT